VAPRVDSGLIETLTARDGLPTLLTLKDGRQRTRHNIAWGYDIGDGFAHVTTNISPEVDGATVDFFYTSEVESIWTLRLASPCAEPRRGNTNRGRLVHPACDKLLR
jgi:hypothetical protein